MAAEKRNKFRESVATETVAEIEENAIAKNDIEDVRKKNTERKSKSNQADASQAGSERANTYRAGSRSKSAAKPAAEAKPAKDRISLMQRWQQFRVFYVNERTQKIIGLLLILFSAYLSIAFVSYFSSWDVDQDKVLGTDLFLPETKVKNWLGKFGALVSHQFMYKG